jgi:formamidopyrimidine-DNA glycosylase
MPELPNITVYLEALESRILQRRLERVVIVNPFVLRSFDPAPSVCEGREVTSLRRLGKRIVIGFDGDVWAVIHLMIAGQLHWFSVGSRRPKRPILAAFEFDSGTLTLTEAGTKRRASMHFVASAAALGNHDPGGLDVHAATLEQFTARLTQANHTLKRALTDPKLFDGIGNAYSDEILHAAHLSPLALSRSLDSDEIARLYVSVRNVLTAWTDRLRSDSGGEFPERVTAFRPGMAVHGRYGQPCPVCGTSVQRIRYAENETNYCPRCQTGGRLLSDRSLARLLKDDWPRTIDELERRGAGL